MRPDSMKKMFPLIVGIGALAGMVLAALFFFFQLRQNSALKQDLSGKKAELQEAQSNSKKMEELEKKGLELRQQEGKINKMVAEDESQPLELIKAISVTAGRIGLRNVKFQLIRPSGDRAAASPPGLVPVRFQMKFEAGFGQVLRLLKELAALERITSVEKIEIRREDKILPYQSVALDLAAYSFPQGR